MLFKTDHLKKLIDVNLNQMKAVQSQAELLTRKTIQTGEAVLSMNQAILSQTVELSLNLGSELFQQGLKHTEENLERVAQGKLPLANVINMASVSEGVEKAKEIWNQHPLKTLIKPAQELFEQSLESVPLATWFASSTQAEKNESSSSQAKEADVENDPTASQTVQETKDDLQSDLNHDELRQNDQADAVAPEQIEVPNSNGDAI